MINSKGTLINSKGAFKKIIIDGEEEEIAIKLNPKIIETNDRIIKKENKTKEESNGNSTKE